MLGPTSLTFRQGSSSLNGERNISAGAIWSVGGLAPPSVGVADGRGGLIGSGTNAPLYATTFASSQPKAQEEIENHERRLELALDLARTGRVLEFSNRLLPSIRTHQTGKGFPEPFAKTVWNGSEWILKGPQQSKKTFGLSGIL
jgi:meiosis-specific APC/C activator protein AMA1